MDVISGRKTGGKITGTITVNGRPKDDDSFRKLVGYVEQNDIHDPFTTVREGLLFAARLVRGVPLAESKCGWPVAVIPSRGIFAAKRSCLW
jgi:ABC-type multidrug transport system ATPase subunit